MNIPPAALKRMSEFGLSIEQALELAELMRPARSSAAERQARYRDRQRSEADLSDVTRDVTRDASSDVTDPLSLSPSPQTPQPHTHTPPRDTTGARSQPKSNGFARFWEAYPNKTGKGAAEKAYAKAVAKITGPDPPSLLLSALERVKPTWRDRQFIPNPTTWLNQERWEDQPETVVPLDVRRSDRPSPSAGKLAEHEDNLRRAFAGSERAAVSRGFG